MLGQNEARKQQEPSPARQRRRGLGSELSLTQAPPWGPKKQNSADANAAQVINVTGASRQSHNTCVWGGGVPTGGGRLTRQRAAAAPDG
jgi:hypothetical protein